MCLIILGHKNKESLAKKIIHINTPVSKISDEFIKLLEKVEYKSSTRLSNGALFASQKQVSKPKIKLSRLN